MTRQEFKDYFQSQVENTEADLAFSKSEKFSADDFKKAIKFVKENAGLQRMPKFMSNSIAFGIRKNGESFTKFIE